MSKILEITTYDAKRNVVPFMKKKITLFDRLRTMWMYRSFKVDNISIAHMIVKKYNDTHDEKIRGWGYRVLW